MSRDAAQNFREKAGSEGQRWSLVGWLRFQPGPEKAAAPSGRGIAPGSVSTPGMLWFPLYSICFQLTARSLLDSFHSLPRLPSDEAGGPVALTLPCS